MQQRVTSVVSGAAMVSMIGVDGDITQPDAYRPVWLSIVAMASLLLCIGCQVRPPNQTKRQCSKEHRRTNNLLAGQPTAAV